MANENQCISRIKLDNIEYEIKDGEAREALSTCVTNVSATTDSGLKVDNTDTNNPMIAIDDSITFIFDCGTAAEYYEVETE